MVRELRQWWRTHQNPKFLFPSPGRGWADRTFTLSQSMHLNAGPMSESCVQSAYRLARAASGVNPASTTHTLRQNAECREMPSEVNQTVRTLRD